MLKLVEDIPLLESILYNKKARKPTMDKQSMMVRPSWNEENVTHDRIQPRTINPLACNRDLCCPKSCRHIFVVLSRSPWNSFSNSAYVLPARVATTNYVQPSNDLPPGHSLSSTHLALKSQVRCIYSRHGKAAVHKQTAKMWLNHHPTDVKTAPPDQGVIGR